MKSHILLSGLPYDLEDELVDSPEAFLHTWQDAYAGIRRHIYRGPMHQHPHYIQVDVYTGAMRAFWIDSLSAYYPGLLTLAGELDEAIETHLLYTALWTRYSALPERWSTATGNIEMGLRWWGGRPEFIESSWYLYRATKDPWYLHVGEMTLRDIKRRCWTRCGWAGLQDVRTGEQSDRMESFFLGETAKYLFLLFDFDHPLNHLEGPWVFTTEGHPLIIPDQLRQNKTFVAARDRTERQLPDYVNDAVCPRPPPHLPFTISATAARDDVFHAASLARLHLMPDRNTLESPLIEFNADHPSISLSDIRSPSNFTYYPWTLPPELIPYNGTSKKMVARATFDLSFPNLPNTMLNAGSLQRISGGILVNSMSGLRLGMVRETEGSASRGESVNDLFRIYAVSNVALGRDEKVFMSRDVVSSFNPADPYFTRTRDLTTLDLFIDALEPPPSTASTKESMPDESDPDRTDALDDLLDSSFVNDTLSLISIPESLEMGKMNPSLISSLLQNIQNILTETLPFDSLAHPSPNAPTHDFKDGKHQVRRVQLSAALSTGPGAAPPPHSPANDEGNFEEDESLPWTKVFIGEENCDSRLPANVPREHQVVILKRGGCSFSQKLANIPAYAPSQSSLKFVVIVSYPEHEEGGGDFVQPLLEEEQKLAGGIPRPHPIPMVMLGGGDETMRLFRRALGVGIRRRWWYESQGLRIGNLIVV